MRLSLASLVKRLPGLRLADDAELNWVPSLASRGLAELKIAHDGKG
jgi:cytochrome P450